MTKHLRIILSLILLMSVSAAKASTLYYVVDNIRYVVNTDDSTAMVATYGTYKDMTEITIPKHYGERVCLPCDFARRILFQRFESLMSITISNSVTKLGALCFADCSGLATVKLPESITDISGAFYHCTGLNYDSVYLLLDLLVVKV